MHQCAACALAFQPCHSRVLTRVPTCCRCRLEGEVRKDVDTLRKHVDAFATKRERLALEAEIVSVR